MNRADEKKSGSGQEDVLCPPADPLFLDVGWKGVSPLTPTDRHGHP